uniref:Uncharacterized protein n=1 Tax=Anguilla anguilla TaxID=7936 RepID=A0A0E9R1R7_ANGAN
MPCLNSYRQAIYSWPACSRKKRCQLVCHGLLPAVIIR